MNNPVEKAEVFFIEYKMYWLIPYKTKYLGKVLNRYWVKFQKLFVQLLDFKNDEILHKQSQIIIQIQIQSFI